jgi:deoxyribodipyrimidine photo-lyase
MVQAKLNEKKIQFFTSKDQIIFEASEVTKPDGKPYTVFTPFKKTWYKTLDNHEYDFLASYPIERHLKSTGVASRLIQKEEIESIRLKLSKPGRNEPVLQVRSLSDMGFVEAKDLIVGAGSAAADEQLDSFIKTHLLSYKDQRDFPDLRATSNLSTHLRFGTLSIRKCFRAALNIVRAQTEPKAKENAETWLSELIWREFYSMILQAYPHVQEKAFKPEYQNLMWRVDEKLFQAWADGMTGYPIVDAGMRQLKQTGLMHNRVRMITASFLTKDLLIDWRKGEAHFARYLLDFDLASNNGGWQWASSTGTDAVPYFRIFNPSLQSGKFDPEAKYIKEFVPELKNIEPAKIHKLEFSVANYPKPIIRHDEAKNAVMSLFKRTTAMKDKES